jgi:DNA modification methylase
LIDRYVTLHQGDALTVLKDMPDESVDMCMTSPPYWGLRNYHVDGQIGLEKTYQEYIDHLMLIFSEVKRVLKKTGTVWVNIADSYAGSGKGIGTDRTKCKEVYTDEDINKTAWQNVDVPAKSLIGIPERFALAMTDRLGYVRRNTIIWYKRNPMPESVKDRFTEDFEYLYFFSKQGKYYFEQQFEAMQNGWENYADSGLCQKQTQKKYSAESLVSRSNATMNPLGRNKRCVWEINTEASTGPHYAAYPEKLCEIPILAGCPADGTVLDPFAGTGTTGAVSKRLGRKSVLIELNPEYCGIIKKRMESITMPMELSI